MMLQGIFGVVDPDPERFRFVIDFCSYDHEFEVVLVNQGMKGFMDVVACINEACLLYTSDAADE